MAARFIIGRAGSGKTQYCFAQIVSACQADPLGPPIYWLLPKQATFQAERHLACESGLPAICRASVLSFSQFGDLISQQCGGIAIPEISAGGRQMIIGHLLRTHQKDLKFFRSVARQPGLAVALDTTFAELERYGKSADDIINHPGTGDFGDPLSAKFHDLRLLYDQYTKYLGQDRLDQHRRLQQVVECIRDWPVLKEAQIFVDGFFDFAQQERQLLAALAQGCRSLQITLLMPPDRPTVPDPKHRPDAMDLFHRTQQTYSRVNATFREMEIPIDPPLLLREAAHGASPAMRFAEAHLFNRTSVFGSESPDVHLLQAPSRRMEIDAVARHIRSLLKLGLRLRDIAVLARDLNNYHDLIAASFSAHNIPCFIDQRRSASHHPLIRFTRLLPTLAGGNWPADTMIGLLKSGFPTASRHDTDELENYVLAHRVRGSLWPSPKPWTLRRQLTKSEQADSADEQQAMQRIDATRKALVEPLINFSTLLRDLHPVPVREIVRGIHEVFEKAKVRQTLSQWIAAAQAADRFEEAAVHEQLWAEITALLDQMADLLGDEAVTPSEFTDILETGLDKFDLALTPPTVDQVLVGTVDRTRTPELKAIILIGWHDGGFPLKPSPGAILSDTDREQMDVGGSIDRLLLDERLLAYYAVTRSTQHLCITRPAADDQGKLLPPSAYWSQVERLFPLANRTIIQRSCDEDCIATPRQLTTALMRWAQHPESTNDTESPWPPLYQWFATDLFDPSLPSLRTRAWAALSYENTPTLSPAIAARLFSSPLSGQIGQIESFNACPFQHFASHGLALRGRSSPQVTGADLSRLYHVVLQNVVDEMIRTHRDWLEAGPHLQEQIHHETRAIGSRLRNEIMLSSARNQYLLQRVEKTLHQVMAAQEAVIRRGKFRPEAVDFRFGGDAEIPAFSINTPIGNRVELAGKIDRIDLLRSPKGISATAMDYRLGGETLALDRVYHGLSLQLLTYLLVLQANGESLVGAPINPAAAFYVQLLRKLKDVDHPREATPPEDPAFDLQVKPRGIFDARYVRAFDEQIDSGWSDVVQVYVKKGGKELGNIRSCDTADKNEFSALLKLVRHRIGEAVDRLLSGDIRVHPVRLKQQSPCATCSFASVCRFDSTINRYRTLEPLDRTEVLERLKSE
jgi:ATP-dependent helicase/nuclease subunit B